MLTSLLLHAMGTLFFHPQIQTRVEFSYGFVDDQRGHVYFLVEYLEFQRPRGIARFPDGGRVRRLTDTTSLFRYHLDSGETEKLYVLAERNPIGGNLRYTRFECDSDTITFVYRASNAIGTEGLAFGGWNAASDTSVSLSQAQKTGLADGLSGMRAPTGPWNRSELSAHMRALPRDTWR